MVLTQEEFREKFQCSEQLVKFDSTMLENQETILAFLTLWLNLNIADEMRESKVGSILFTKDDRVQGNVAFCYLDGFSNNLRALEHYYIYHQIVDYIEETTSVVSGQIPEFIDDIIDYFECMTTFGLEFQCNILPLDWINGIRDITLKDLTEGYNIDIDAYLELVELYPEMTMFDRFMLMYRD